MRLLLTILIFTGTAAAMPALTADDLVLRGPFVRRNDGFDNRHMIDLTFDQKLFTGFNQVMAEAVPIVVEALRIPDTRGWLPATGLTGFVAYNLTNIYFENVLAENSTLHLRDGYMDVVVHLESRLVANYTLSGRVGLVNKSTSGKVVVTLEGGLVTGRLIITNNEGGIYIAVNDVSSSVHKFSIKMADTWWLNILTRIMSSVAEPIISSTLGTVVSAAVPPLVNVLFGNQVSIGFTLPNGRKLGFGFQVVGEPRITEENVIIGMDLVTTAN